MPFGGDSENMSQVTEIEIIEAGEGSSGSIEVAQEIEQEQKDPQAKKFFFTTPSRQNVVCMYPTILLIILYLQMHFIALNTHHFNVTTTVPRA